MLFALETHEDWISDRPHLDSSRVAAHISLVRGFLVHA